MKTLKILFLTLVTMICTSTASAQTEKEVYSLCQAQGFNCTSGLLLPITVVNWGQGTWVEFSLDNLGGCPESATFTIYSRNDFAGRQLITTLKFGEKNSQVFMPMQWSMVFFAQSDDITGCTDLALNMYVVRPTRR